MSSGAGRARPPDVLLQGGCHCDALRFEIQGEIRMRGLCLCTTCQRISGGACNRFIGIDAGAFRYVRGLPQRFRKPGSIVGPTRESCADCGTHVAARSPRAPGGLIVKVGALDDPGLFGGATIAVWTSEKQAFHRIPEGATAFPRVPGQGPARR